MLVINYVILDQSGSHEDEEKWFDFVLMNGMQQSMEERNQGQLKVGLCSQMIGITIYSDGKTKREIGQWWIIIFWDILMGSLFHF